MLIAMPHIRVIVVPLWNCCRRVDLKEPDASPICLAMPLTAEPYISDSLFPFFSNLLSEGSNREFQAKYHHLAPDDDFGLLLKTASYDTIGSVTVREIVL